MRTCACGWLFLLGLLWTGFTNRVEATDTVIVGDLLDAEVLLGVSGEISLALNDSENLVTRHAKSDELGRVEFRDVTAGKWQLTTKISDYAPEYATIDVVEGETHHVSFYLKKGRLLSGRIIDRDGKPIAKARVSVRYARDSGTIRAFVAYGWQSGDVTTNLQGEYVIRDVHPEKEFVVEASHVDYLTSVSVPLVRGTAASGSVNLSLHKGLSVTGTIQDDNGTPVSGARVGLLGTLPPAVDRFLALSLLKENRRFTVSDDEGAFRFGQVQAGEKLILVSHSAYRKTEYFLTLPKSGQDSPVIVTLSP